MDQPQAIIVDRVCCVYFSFIIEILLQTKHNSHWQHFFCWDNVPMNASGGISAWVSYNFHTSIKKENSTHAVSGVLHAHFDKMPIKKIGAIM